MVGWQVPLLRASTPLSFPSPLRLGCGDRRRRRRGRAAARRAGIAGGSQALCRPLLRAPPLRSRQVCAGRRAPKVRSALAGVYGHRLRGSAVSATRTHQLGRALIKTTTHHRLASPPLCAAGGQTRGGSSHRSPSGPRREGWRATAEWDFPLASVEGRFRVGLPAFSSDLRP